MLARDFGRTVSSEERMKAIREGGCCDLVASEYDKTSQEPLEKPGKGGAPLPKEKSLFQALVQMVLVLGSICCSRIWCSAACCPS